MSTDIERQRVSAFMDGETGQFETAAAVKGLLRDPELADCWERWHLIGRGLRGESSQLAARSLASQVRAATVAEPDVMETAPVARARRSWLDRPTAAALAAGVGAVAVALLLRVPLSEPDPGNPRLIVEGGAAERWQQPDPAVRTQLDRLLVNHQEQVAGFRSGVAGYAAVIGYEAGP